MEPPITELLLSGIKLMLMGMTIVFLFLALLVWIIGVSSRLVRRYEQTLGQVGGDAALMHDESSLEPDEGEIIAAISAALWRHENR
ncbi:MAG: OadG family protein [Methylococcaceae bacterium]